MFVSRTKYGAPLVAAPIEFVLEKNSTLLMTPLGSCASARTANSAGAMKTVPLVGLRILTVGAVVSVTLTVWLHWELLPQASIARQVRVALKVFPHAAFVTVLTMEMVVALHRSVAIGGSKSQALPCSTALLALQLMTGAVMSTTVTV